MLRLALLLFAFSASATAQSDTITREAAAKLAQGTFREYLELLALPNDAITPADIQKNVDWLERAFRKRGFTTRQLENKGKPMLFAEWPAGHRREDRALLHAPRRPPVVAFGMVAAEPLATGGEETQRPPATGRSWRRRLLFADELDPDLRVFARAASDDKGADHDVPRRLRRLEERRVDPASTSRCCSTARRKKARPRSRRW